MSSLYEDAQKIEAARAKRMQLIEQLGDCAMLADSADLPPQDMFEALANGRNKVGGKTDPDYWTFKILQYLYEYVPFGKAGRWFVPVILGLGLYKAFEVIGDIIEAGWSSLKSSSMYQTLKEYIPFLPDRIVRDGAGEVVGATSSKLLQAGLMGVLPPYATMVVATLAPRVGTAANSDAKVAALTRENEQLKAALAATGKASTGTLLPASYNPYMPTVAPAAPAPVASAPVDNTPYWQKALIDKGLDWLMSDRVVRDANAPTSFGTLRSGRSNY